MPRPSKPMKPAAQEASFRWIVEPEDGMLEGTAYSDGSFLDGPIPELARGGWAFAVLNDMGVVVASACGVPPPWIKDIGGAEAWAVLQVGLRAIPGRIKYMVDCQPCVHMIHGVVATATMASRPLARVNAMVMSALEDTEVAKVVWMPAHKSKQAAGQFRCSDGQLITEADIRGNAEADKLAKLAVRRHRVDSAEVTLWERLCKAALGIAKWIARATWAANNCEDAPFSGIRKPVNGELPYSRRRPKPNELLRSPMGVTTKGRRMRAAGRISKAMCPSRCCSSLASAVVGDARYAGRARLRSHF